MSTAILEQEIEKMREENLSLKQEIRLKELTIKHLLKELYGLSSEKLPKDPNQLSFLDEVVTPALAPVSNEVLAQEKEEKKKRTPRHPIPAEIETVTIRLEPEEKICPHCGKEKCEISHEKTEELEFIPAKLIKKEIIRPKLACLCGEGSVSIAPLPQRLIEKGRPGPGLLAQVALSKYVDHLPLYRQEMMFARLGVNLSRKTLCDWVEAVAFWLKPIYEQMKEEVLKSSYLQIDETPVRVMDPEVAGKTAQGYLWVYGEPNADILFEYAGGRGLLSAPEFLKNYQGTIQTDGYAVYQAAERANPGLKRIGCWAHARRKFYDAQQEDPAQGLWFLSKISRLYHIERRARDEGLAPPERKKLREAQAPPVLEEIKHHLDQLKGNVLPKGLLGQAVHYALNEWEALTKYVSDGSFEIDNNLCENSIRPTALGKKNWLFLGHPDAAWRSAVIYSLVVSCQRRGIDPAKYLRDVLNRLPEAKNYQIAEFTPARWTPRN